MKNDKYQDLFDFDLQLFAEDNINPPSQTGQTTDSATAGRQNSVNTNSTAGVTSEQNKTVQAQNEKRDPYKRGQRHAWNDIAFHTKSKLGEEIRDVDSLLNYIDKLKKPIEEPKTEKQIEEKIDPKIIEENRNLKRDLKELNTLKEEYKILMEEKIKTEQRIQEDQIRSIFKEALLKNNCSAPDLIVDNSKYFGRLKTDGKGNLDVYSLDGQPDEMDLQDFILQIKEKNPQIFTVIKVNSFQNNKVEDYETKGLSRNNKFSNVKSHLFAFEQSEKLKNA